MVFPFLLPSSSLVISQALVERDSGASDVARLLRAAGSLRVHTHTHAPLINLLAPLQSFRDEYFDKVL